MSPFKSRSDSPRSANGDLRRRFRLRRRTGVTPDITEDNSAPIDVRGVCHSYGTGDARKQILFDNHLQVQAGEIVMITGQSGCGKTTLLTLIGTLRGVQEGRLNLLGQPLHNPNRVNIHALRKRLGFIFQAHNLFSSLTALQNVRMALELQSGRWTRQEQDRRCEEMLVAVGLGQRVHHKPRGLSGGQKQRVAVARGLVHQPDVLLADEPTAALDKESGKQVVDLFRREAQERGVAIVIVTHDNRILDVADRIVRMEYGKIAHDTYAAEAANVSEMLQKCTLFTGIAASTLTKIVRTMKREEHAAGSRIVTMGEKGDRFYLIREGSVVVRRPESPESTDVADVVTLGEGDHFGETALISGERRNAHVDAVTETITYSLGGEEFQQLWQQRRSLGEEVRSSLFSD